ncbi:Unknown protein sequence [Pseudomonas savastanoi pv. retacarpa]|uniref:hypothetical protein n=1 Tax=Pseudomonas savastanoi TaxID=29438 RepID=UPI0006E582E4|nr:hypothetical protein [Pseudomonas savastanoi]KPY48445.1 Unknown protein sequence [Pseudomonas savastanoi pv. retacarpa]RMP45598.1 hypothetical protein ALQ22_03642 [Pseudomonas savastanoi pv. retacarpa]RMT72442.1 hypothetical protein ALP41_02789 [Pseudomonas savastanoi pv. nerii]
MVLMEKTTRFGGVFLCAQVMGAPANVIGAGGNGFTDDVKVKGLCRRIPKGGKGVVSGG